MELTPGIFLPARILLTARLPDVLVTSHHIDECRRVESDECVPLRMLHCTADPPTTAPQSPSNICVTEATHLRSLQQVVRQYDSPMRWQAFASTDQQRQVLHVRVWSTADSACKSLLQGSTNPSRKYASYPASCTHAGTADWGLLTSAYLIAMPANEAKFSTYGKAWC